VVMMQTVVNQVMILGPIAPQRQKPPTPNPAAWSDAPCYVGFSSNHL
jgi:hypothetical protein